MNEQHEKFDGLVVVIQNLLSSFAEKFGFGILERILEEIKMRTRPALVPVPACSACEALSRRLRRR